MDRDWSDNSAWMPGMLSNHGARYLGNDAWFSNRGHLIISGPNVAEIPDLEDKSTFAILLVSGAKLPDLRPLRLLCAVMSESQPQCG